MAQLSLKKAIARLLRWAQYPVVKRGLNQGDAFYTAQRTDTGTKCGFGVGGGTTGVNHGVWSHTLNRWLIYGNATDVFVNSSRVGKFSGTATKSGNYYTSGTVKYFCNHGCVQVRLENMTFGTISGTVNIATIPAGFRPPYACYGTFSHSTVEYGSCWVDGNGNVTVTAAVSGKSGMYGSVTYACWQ